MIINSPRGTSDIFGEEINYRNFILEEAKNIFELFNYNEIITPAFEHTQVFSRSIGEGSDIVQKEMYTFSDKKGRSLTLRPEGTASVVRSFIERKLYSDSLPLKLFYIGNMFRYERPQKGRMREFWQLGVEAFGEENPLIDAEVIWMLNLLFNNLGFNNLLLYVNSIGCEKCRKEFINIFIEYVKPLKDRFCYDCCQRIEKNPLRVFDCKNEDCKKLLDNSPKITDYLCSSCGDHFKKVMEYLGIFNINFKINNNLVRGFDYYTRTIFEIVSDDLNSAQNALGGGGRYDKLVQQFGGPDTPAIGFAVGIDRTIVLMKELKITNKNAHKRKKVYITVMNAEFYNFLAEIIKFLRGKGLNCDISYKEKNIKTAIKWAEKNEYDFIVIIGENEVKDRNLTIKNIKTFKQSILNMDKQKDKIIELLKNGE